MEISERENLEDAIAWAYRNREHVEYVSGMSVEDYVADDQKRLDEINQQELSH